ncbi:alcohol dehydrogenase catalytic domain-containing protein [Bacillus sp. FJAT-29790]|uniref:zinc-dependent alcohol dehydrogenase n=1 Tax=Bacillus sp. FJAT-29790 TaxID=1895002 RepID=UPI001C229D53|nr:alcohol dehydrogenase catalytic domain-containing protein [Bacillus sp. FJAT-29790]MBU8881348.1 alcohol dehydrogenase catalytic domain-containing protein [Bacillus sp. FJAT-29790]
MLELYVKKPMEIEMRDVESLQAPKDDEVKIKISYGGLCGSDLSFLQGKFAHATYPLRPGHELVGTIIERGKSAKYEVGTRVVVLPNTFCGECEMCKKGSTNICRRKKSLGINMDGGFSEEYVISSKFVLPIPDDLANEKAVLIEPFAVVVSGFKKVKITKDSSVAIVGGGTIGMLAAALAYCLGAHVTAVDVNPKKHEMIKKIGDIRVVYPEKMADETFDFVIEAAGTKASVELAIQLMKPGGSMVALGIAPEVNIPFSQIVRYDQTIYGSIIYNFPDDFLQTIEYLRDPDLNIEPIVSMVVPFTEYQHAYESALSGDFGKIILNFNSAAH